MPPAEVAALRIFMDGGGGVFATGDHEDLGAWRCIVNDWVLAQSRSTVSLLEKACQHV